MFTKCNSSVSFFSLSFILYLSNYIQSLYWFSKIKCLLNMKWDIYSTIRIISRVNLYQNQWTKVMENEEQKKNNLQNLASGSVLEAVKITLPEAAHEPIMGKMRNTKRTKAIRFIYPLCTLYLNQVEAITTNSSYLFVRIWRELSCVLLIKGT